MVKGTNNRLGLCWNSRLGGEEGDEDGGIDRNFLFFLYVCNKVPVEPELRELADKFAIKENPTSRPRDPDQERFPRNRQGAQQYCYSPRQHQRRHAP